MQREGEIVVLLLIKLRQGGFTVKFDQLEQSLEVLLAYGDPF